MTGPWPNCVHHFHFSERPLPIMTFRWHPYCIILLILWWLFRFYGDSVLIWVLLWDNFSTQIYLWLICRCFGVSSCLHIAANSSDPHGIITCNGPDGKPQVWNIRWRWSVSVVCVTFITVVSLLLITWCSFMPFLSKLFLWPSKSLVQIYLYLYLPESL